MAEVMSRAGAWAREMVQMAEARKRRPSFRAASDDHFGKEPITEKEIGFLVVIQGQPKFQMKGGVLDGDDALRLATFLQEQFGS